MAFYAQVSEMKRRHLEEEEDWAGSLTVFRYYNKPLETVLPFNYLGHFLTTTNYGLPDVIDKDLEGRD